jgi:hypothetical protein
MFQHTLTDAATTLMIIWMFDNDRTVMASKWSR